VLPRCNIVLLGAHYVSGVRVFRTGPHIWVSWHVQGIEHTLQGRDSQSRVGFNQWVVTRRSTDRELLKLSLNYPRTAVPSTMSSVSVVTDGAKAGGY
jgi:hypothetical protein